LLACLLARDLDLLPGFFILRISYSETIELNSFSKNPEERLIEPRAISIAQNIGKRLGIEALSCGTSTLLHRNFQHEGEASRQHVRRGSWKVHASTLVNNSHAASRRLYVA